MRIENFNISENNHQTPHLQMIRLFWCNDKLFLHTCHTGQCHCRNYFYPFMPISRWTKMISYTLWNFNNFLDRNTENMSTDDFFNITLMSWNVGIYVISSNQLYFRHQHMRIIFLPDFKLINWWDIPYQYCLHKRAMIFIKVVCYVSFYTYHRYGVLLLSWFQ